MDQQLRTQATQEVQIDCPVRPQQTRGQIALLYVEAPKRRENAAGGLFQSPAMWVCLVTLRDPVDCGLRATGGLRLLLLK